MPIAITEDHRALGQTASDFLAKRDARGAARALLEAETGVPARVLGRPGRARLARPAPARGARAARASACPSSSWSSRSSAAPSTPGPFVPTVIASAVIDAAGSDELAARLLPGLADGSVLGGVALDVRHHGVAAARPPGRLRRSWAAASPTSSSCPRATTSSSSTPSAGGVTVEVPGQPRPDAPQRPGSTLDGAPADGDPRRAARAGRPGPPHHRGRGGRHRHRVHRAGRRLRQGARAVRPAHRHLPGRQAPLRQHARRRRARHGARVGRRPGGRRGGDQLSLRRGHGRRRSPWRRPTSARSSTSRCTGASASPGSTTPISICAGPPRSRRSWTPRRRHATSPTWCAAGARRARTIDLPPEAEPMRDEVRAFADRVQGLDAAGAARRR